MIGHQVIYNQDSTVFELTHYGRIECHRGLYSLELISLPFILRREKGRSSRADIKWLGFGI